MEAITIETLLTVTGVTLVVGVLLQGVKVLFGNLSGQWLRRIALILGVVLMVVVAVTSDVADGTNTALFYIAAGINGVIAGLAAGAGFDTIKYGDARNVSN